MTTADRLRDIAQRMWLTESDREAITKAARVVSAAEAPRDDLAKYLIRLDTAVQALHK